MVVEHKSVWIISPTKDPHAQIVMLALKSLSIPTCLIDVAEFPIELETQHRIESKHSCIRFGKSKALHSSADCGVVWMRRPQELTLDPRIHEDDRQFAKSEAESALRGVLHGMEFRGVPFVNPILGRTLARSRGLQLEIARTSGLKIPRTLISNDPVAVREFIGTELSAYIYKPSSPSFWPGLNGEGYRCLTTPVSANDLKDDLAIRGAPGCYQELVQKIFDVRAIYFDGHLVCGALRSRYFKPLESDWRAHDPASVDCWPVTPPASVVDGCQRFAKKCGLVFGCFDFVVDADGEWYFLEVNESGQFLFLEKFCSEINVLSHFVSLLSRLVGSPPNNEVQNISLEKFFNWRSTSNDETIKSPCVMENSHELSK